jgi:putative PIN family toxin of toxin-antitoxin system
MRAVLDTNVLVAAYLTEGLCARLLRRARHGQFELITCPAILAETQVHLRKLTSPPPAILKATAQHLENIATIVTPEPTLIPTVCRDPDDNIVLGCAVSATADYVVTGDRDLLVLHPFRNLSVVTPRDFETLFAD